MNNRSVLIVEDDPAMRDTCARMLSRAGYRVEAVADGEAGMAKLRAEPRFRVTLVDLKLPKMDGIAVLEKIREFDSNIKVVIMTGFATVKSAVRAMKLGAVEYLVKPFEKDELLAVVAQQFRVGELESKVERLQSELRGKYCFDNIVWRSEKMEAVLEQVAATCKNKANVLILGESGTGKELIAKAIHYHGLSSKGPFVAVNCAALPESLVESELFGHTKGAFTGAARDSVGLFRTAQGGTIFLDEVFDMSLDIQAKLLRVIQEHTVRPVGGVKESPIDARIIAATNQEPVAAMEIGELRKDLFYRLSVVTIRIPPLRERSEDIPPLIDHIATRLRKTYGLRIGPVSQRVLDILKRYTWPGNVRELENLVEQWFAMGRTNTVTVEDLPAEIVSETRRLRETSVQTDPAGVKPLHDVERAMVHRALEAANHNKSKAAQLLGISRKKLYKLLSDDPSDGNEQPD